MTYRHRARCRRRPVPGRLVGSAVAAGLIVAAVQGHHAGAASRAAPSRAAAEAIAYARAQLGKPYLWSGTGPDTFDCSGRVDLDELGCTRVTATRITTLATPFLPRWVEDSWAGNRSLRLRA